MGITKCPECGSRTVLRTSYKDDSRYYVCINFPDCRGRVAAEDEGYIDIIGDRSFERSKLDGLIRRKEENAPRGMVQVDETPTNIWNKEGYTPKAAPRLPQHRRKFGLSAGSRTGEPSEVRWSRSAEVAEDRARRMRERSRPDGGAGSAVGGSRKSERDSAWGIGRAAKKRRVMADSSWGDDWDDESPSSKAARKSPSPKRLSGKESRSGEKKLSIFRRDAALKEEVSPIKSKKAQARPRPQGEKKGKSALDSKRKAPASRRPRAPQEVIAPKKKRTSAPRMKEAAKAKVSPSKRKGSLAVLIIALVAAFIAIDGMIYAIIVLRGQ